MHEETQGENPLGTQSVGSLMLKYAIPSVVAMLVNSLYNMVDQIFIGQGVGYLGNAATNVILPMTIILLAAGLLIGDGAAAYMSLSLGAGHTEDAARGVGSAVTLTAVCGLALTVLFELFMLPACRLFGSTEASLPYALEYGRIIVLGFPFSMIDAAFGGIIRADGRPKVSMAGLLIGCGTNLILDPIFIFVFKWGVAGAAWATIIGQILNAVYFAVCAAHFKSIRLERRHLRPSLPVVKRVLSLGASSFITQAASVLVIAIMNNCLVKYGAVSKYGADIPLAALGITMKVGQLLIGVAIGIATGIQPIFGFNYGSRRYDRVKKTFFLALTSCMLILVAAFFIFQLFPEQIISVFGQESELYMEFAVKCMRIYMLACFMIGAGVVTGIFFQAIGRPVMAAVLSLSRQIIFLIPAILIFAHFMGVEGILWSGAFSDAVSGVMCLAAAALSWKKIFAEA